MDEEIDLETFFNLCQPSVIPYELETTVRELNQTLGTLELELDEVAVVGENFTDALTELEQICRQENYFQPLHSALYCLNQTPSTDPAQQNELEVQLEGQEDPSEQRGGGGGNPTHEAESIPDPPPPATPPSPLPPTLPSSPPATPPDQRDPVDAINVETIRRDRFNNLELRSLLNFPQIGRVIDYATFYREVMRSLENLLERVIPELRPNDMLQLELIGENMQRHTSVNYQNDDEAVMAAFQSLVDQLVQSNAAIMEDGGLELVVQVVHNHRGGAKRKLENTLDCEILSKKAPHLYVTNNSNNQLCFAVSLAHLIDSNLTDSQAVNFGRELQRLVGLDEHTPVTFSDISKFEKIVKRKIMVLYRDEGQRPLSRFETDSPQSDKPLYLYLSQEHYYGIKNIKGFTGRRYICSYCHIGYNDPHKHTCAGHCLVCIDPTCSKEKREPVLCKDCNKMCRSPSCMVRHKKRRMKDGKRVSLCDLQKKCPKCKLFYCIPTSTGFNKHKCPRARCKICGEALPSDSKAAVENHLCYIQPLPRDSEHTDKLIFYDFETFVDDRHVHVPFLVCTKTLKGLEWMAYGQDCVTAFLTHFRRPLYRGSTFIAHNSRGFDGYLLLNGMVELGLQPSIIMQGSKVLCFEDPDFNLKYIDSLSFLTMRLSAMPKALGFDDQTKGYFPHKFSSEKRLNYKGPYPPPSDYGIERMTDGEQEKFYGWYKEASRRVFDFKKQAIHYCKNDVDILSTGCIKFREEFLSETGVDPFSRITIASACMKVFVTNFLPPRSLAIPSPDNYRHQCKTYSRASIQWLEWVSYTQGVFIQHALNRGEKQIGKYYVDGYAEVGGVRYAWEFQGCFYHGCPTCYDPSATCPMTNTPYEELHLATEEKIQTLKSVYGVHTYVMREHEWVEMKKSHPRVVKFLKTSDFPEPLSPRQALFGGRTSAFRLRYTAGEDERVLYADVTSLYPYVNSVYPYPLGHPVIIHRDFDNPENYYGLIRAVIYPPRGLYLPLLPYKTSKGKLVFTLCRTCAEINNQQGACRHDEEDRALTGVWVTVEFNKALQLGYRVGKITEVWHFEERSDTIFSGYVQTFLKGKQEASGYPPEAVDQESREKYIREYRDNQGIQLNVGKIEVNPAKRQMSKLCLNSLWGKFAQKNILTQTTLVKSEEEFFDLVFSGKYEVKYFSFLSDKTAMVQWNYSKGCVVPPSKVNNVFIAAFTTAYARLKMYGYLERLQERVLYTDTDSLVYVVKEGETPLELGAYLGQLTDELGGDSIQEFASAGPKSYAYQTRQEKKTVLRAKGITQTQECCDRINFDSVKELVEGYLERSEEGVIDTPHQQVVRDKRGFLLRNSSFQKKFRVVYDKRRLFPDGTTLPFGY